MKKVIVSLLVLCISHAEGVTTIDHVTELPDMSDLLGE